MNSHPYLRAFLAGAFVPTLVLPLMLTGFIVLRLVLQLPFRSSAAWSFPWRWCLALGSLEHALARLLTRAPLPIGVHGALLPLLLMPGGAVVATSWDPRAWLARGDVVSLFLLSLRGIAPLFLAALAGYYLVWKYVVGFSTDAGDRVRAATRRFHWLEEILSPARCAWATIVA